MTKVHQIIDKQHRFIAGFDQATGAYFRSGVMRGGKITSVDPFMASFPHLLDIGIMGHCVHGSKGLCMAAGVECYQSGLNKSEPNMTLADYQSIINQCEGRVFQVALGGRGDPDLHESFAEILSFTRGKGIVPNLTTSGFGLTKQAARLIAEYCGAAAVSWYRSDYTLRAINTLLEAGVKTNIHFVLSNSSIDEALKLLSERSYPQGINRVIFLLHKPVGLGRHDNVLSVKDPRVAKFFGKFDSAAYANIAGFDSCSVPGLIHFAAKVMPMTYDTCEAARFSAYVTPDLKLTPCSFDQELKWGVDLRNYSIAEAWYSSQFESFRRNLMTNCQQCRHRLRCLGGCPISREIVLCKKVQGGVTNENPHRLCNQF